jgi:hypothetical protein
MEEYQPETLLIEKMTKKRRDAFVVQHQKNRIKPKKKFKSMVFISMESERISIEWFRFATTINHFLGFISVRFQSGQFF